MCVLIAGITTKVNAKAGINENVLVYCYYKMTKQANFKHECFLDKYNINSNEFFTLRNQPHVCGDKYVVNKQRCSNNRRNNFFSSRIVNLWNNLPSSTTDFTSFRKFDKSLNNDYLLLYCKLNFK